MLKIRLFMTTALTVVGSMSVAAAQLAEMPEGRSSHIAIAAAGSVDSPAPGTDLRRVFENPGRDRNSEFLCTYGYRVSHTQEVGSGYRQVHWQEYAAPIIGKGASVSGIFVTDSPSDGSNFYAGIYTNRHGEPSQLLAAGKGKAKGSCGLTRVGIPKTFLAAGTKYWIVENSERKEGAVSWGYRPNSRRKGLYQYYSFSSSSGYISYSYLSPWLAVSGPAPFVKVM